MQESKALWNRNHFKRRLKERYGIKISNCQYHKLIKDVQTGKAMSLRSQSKTRTIFELDIQGKPVIVVYSKSQHNLVTALKQTHRI